MYAVVCRSLSACLCVCVKLFVVCMCVWETWDALGLGEVIYLERYFYFRTNGSFSVLSQNKVS